MTAEGCVVVPEELLVERPADWRHGAEDSEHGANRRRASARRDTVPLPLTLTGRDEMSLVLLCRAPCKGAVFQRVRIPSGNFRSGR